ncbi:Mitochondrial import inner membrane translocase subunit [Musa troglodytarum]|uniref:Mitochondrial import inner membrane translocase subunit n=1 Tax=Musa troglodytarum TaxID=320322 RepID=A0A9E7H3E8_9LILI|nr:Mitochondrial import inner membrane translocase subunit [Musa troglodytarum]
MILKWAPISGFSTASFAPSTSKTQARAMDKRMLGDLDSLPEEDKIRMSAMIDQLQIWDSLRRRCFSDCVDTFRRKSLDKQEET